MIIFKNQWHWGKSRYLHTATNYLIIYIYILEFLLLFFFCLFFEKIYKALYIIIIILQRNPIPSLGNQLSMNTCIHKI